MIELMLKKILITLPLTFFSFSAFSEDSCLNGYLKANSIRYRILEKFECYGSFFREQKSPNNAKCLSIKDASANGSLLSKRNPNSTIYLTGSTVFTLENKGEKLSLLDDTIVGSPSRIINVTKFLDYSKRGFILNSSINRDDFIEDEKPLFNFTQKNIRENYWDSYAIPADKRFKGVVFIYEPCTPKSNQIPSISPFDSQANVRFKNYQINAISIS